MIERLIRVENVGVFTEARAGGDPTRFDPLTLVYAENGRGKTTLSAILRSLVTGDPAYVTERARISCWIQASEPGKVFPSQEHAAFNRGESNEGARAAAVVRAGCSAVRSAPTVNMIHRFLILFLSVIGWLGLAACV